MSSCLLCSEQNIAEECNECLWPQPDVGVGVFTCMWLRQTHKHEIYYSCVHLWLRNVTLNVLKLLLAGLVLALGTDGSCLPKITSSKFLYKPVAEM